LGGNHSIEEGLNGNPAALKKSGLIVLLCADEEMIKRVQTEDDTIDDYAEYCRA
jgi:hypothetical protein